MESFFHRVEFWAPRHSFPDSPLIEIIKYEKIIKYVIINI